MTQEQARSLQGLLFDLDGTLLDDGQLSVAALQALYRMKAAGLHLIGVTGRPCSWGQVLLRQWPVDAMITENGIVGLSRHKGRIALCDGLSEPVRKIRQTKLHELARSLHRQFPQLQPGDDTDGRRCDYTFDIGEFAKLPADEIAELRRAALKAGANVVVSSIHLHISYDAADKASGSVHMLGQLFGIDATACRYRYAFIGDSGNDAPCFAAFHHSVGVANLSPTMPILPRYLTIGKASAGFCQLAEHLISARNS